MIKNKLLVDSTAYVVNTVLFILIAIGCAKLFVNYFPLLREHLSDSILLLYLVTYILVLGIPIAIVHKARVGDYIKKQLLTKYDVGNKSYNWYFNRFLKSHPRIKYFFKLPFYLNIPLYTFVVPILLALALFCSVGPAVGFPSFYVPWKTLLPFEVFFFILYIPVMVNFKLINYYMLYRFKPVPEVPLS